MPVDHFAYIGIGSNIEPRDEYLRLAIVALGEIGTIEALSAIHETEPIGYAEQPKFLNGVVLLRTQLAPEAFHKELRAIERKLGRKTRPRWHEREIDLDLLFYDDLVMHTDTLTIPHPELQNRLFVLEPLAEIAFSYVHPVLQQPIRTLLSALETSQNRQNGNE